MLPLADPLIVFARALLTECNQLHIFSTIGERPREPLSTTSVQKAVALTVDQNFVEQRIQEPIQTDMPDNVDLSRDPVDQVRVAITVTDLDLAGDHFIDPGLDGSIDRVFDDRDLVLPVRLFAHCNSQAISLANLPPLDRRNKERAAIIFKLTNLMLDPHILHPIMTLQRDTRVEITSPGKEPRDPERAHRQSVTRQRLVLPAFVTRERPRVTRTRPPDNQRGHTTRQHSPPSHLHPLALPLCLLRRRPNAASPKSSSDKSPNRPAPPTAHPDASPPAPHSSSISFAADSQDA